MKELEWLPPHKASLHITHNEHLGLYQSVEEWCAERNADDFVPGERERIIATGEVWEIQWYPQTPVGFCTLAASSLEALRAHFEGKDT